MRKPIPILAAVAALGAAAWAGPPPDTCRVGSPSGCEFESDVFVFGAGDPVLRIEARIVECAQCTPPAPDGSFQFDGEIRVEFGPYVVGGADCGPTADVVALGFDDVAIKDPASVGEAQYVPFDPAVTYTPFPHGPLETRCMDEDHLEYRIPRVQFRGSDGAHAAGGANPAWLYLPDGVRSTLGRKILLPSFPLPQNLDFRIQQVNSSPSLRYWPEGMPFRMGPGEIEYYPSHVVFASLGTVSPDYEVAVPAADGAIVGVDCEPPEVSMPWSCSARWNAGWLDHAGWTPQNVSFDRGGFDLDLSLGGGASVDWQPVFPAGVWLRLTGPASASMREGAIDGGGFSGGTLWLRPEARLCGAAPQTRVHALNSGALAPQITANGGLLAGVSDLNEVQPGQSQSELLRWTFNRASSLGCGTLWVPPFVAPRVRAGATSQPQDTFLAPQGPVVEGRGLYAGVNYNRNRVCEGGDADSLRCGDDTDCPGGGTCVADVWSPLCPSHMPPAAWGSAVQDDEPIYTHYYTKTVPPDDLEREMVFAVRRSGVTGVFDGGNDPTTVGGSPALNFEFSSWGHAFRGSRSELGDTIMRGGILFPWPAGTQIPFSDLRLCDCGPAKNASVPDGVAGSTLKYWAAPFTPFGLTFTQDSTVGEVCQASAGSVTVAAITPIPHFAPEPVSEFTLDAGGNPGPIEPVEVAQFQFEPNAQGMTPWAYDVSKFVLQPHVGSITEAMVYGDPPTADIGYYDAEGEVALPFFGQVEAGTMLRREGLAAPTYELDVHETGFPDVDGHRFVRASRKMANGTIDLPFRLDYFRPGETAADDGLDEDGVGAFLGYADSPGQPKLVLGAVPMASSFVLRPGSAISDLGVGAPLRLWSSLGSAHRPKLATVMPADQVLFGAAQYDDALTVLGGTLPADAQAAAMALHDTGAVAEMAGHVSGSAAFDVAPPGMQASSSTGYLALSGDLQMVEQAVIDGTIDTGGSFFGLDRAVLSIDRHVKDTANGALQPIQEFTRRPVSGAMDLPAELSVGLPSFPGLEWDFDFDVLPSGAFDFNSLTGTLDLTQGALSGLAFKEAGFTLKYWDDGDWYFDAGLRLSFNGFGANGGILLGNTKTMQPLKAMDPAVGNFLGGLSSFQGGYAKVGIMSRVFDLGCLLEVTAGAEVGGWYVSGYYGGKLRGWVAGEGACTISIRGDMTLLGTTNGDVYRLGGDVWLAGGAGFCDEEDWDTPADVLDDDFCAACVFSGAVYGETPPKEIELTINGPDVECAL